MDNFVRVCENPDEKTTDQKRDKSWPEFLLMKTKPALAFSTNLWVNFWDSFGMSLAREP